MSFGQIARFSFAVIIFCFAGITVSAQTKPVAWIGDASVGGTSVFTYNATTDLLSVQTKPAPIVAPPSQQKEFRTLVEARTKAQTAYDAQVIKLPEYAAFNAAKKALEDAAAKLPVKANLDDAQAAVMEAAFRNMAELKLSSYEYLPILDDKTGELTFAKKVTKGGP